MNSFSMFKRTFLALFYLAKDNIDSGYSFVSSHAVGQKVYAYLWSIFENVADAAVTNELIEFFVHLHSSLISEVAIKNELLRRCILVLDNNQPSTISRCVKLLKVL